MKKINKKLALFCSVALLGTNEKVLLTDICFDRVEKAVLDLEDNSLSYNTSKYIPLFTNYEDLKEFGKYVISKSVNEMLADEIVSYSIEKGDNQIIRLLSILDHKNTIYDFDSLSYDKILYLYFKEEFDIDIYKLAVGFENHDKNSLSIYMNKYFDKIKTREVVIEDIYDFNMIYNYFSTWGNFDNSYLTKINEILVIQEKEHLSQFIGTKGAVYEHYNPLTGFKNVCQEIEILTYIPFGGEKKFYFSKEFKNIIFSEISNTLYYDDNISIYEENDIIEYTIKHDPSFGCILRATIPTNNINKELSKTYYK